jgi:peptidoglycan/LPS O-acetylase OafA/YrhL
MKSRNNIGLLRLVLASAVIFGHSPEMLDGNRSREPLTVLFHTLSLGELAVDGFFMLSGYLITKSMIQTNAAIPYLERRVLRIYPAFVLAYILAVFVLGPLAGANIARHLPHALINIPLLRGPLNYPDAFKGLAATALNGSMWTIRIEFECYLLILLLWFVGILRHRLIVLALAAALVLATAWLRSSWGLDAQARLNGLHIIYVALGHPFSLVRLSGVFLTGACFYFFKPILIDKIGTALAAVCGALALAALYHDPAFAEAALTTFGAVFLFWLSFKAKLGPLQSINDNWDISYGVYLYGWPASIGLMYFAHLRSPLGLSLAALALSCLLGAASWWGLESRVKDLVRSRSRRLSPAGLEAPAVVDREIEVAPS